MTAETLIQAVKATYKKKLYTANTQTFYTELAIVDRQEQREKEKENLKNNTAQQKSGVGIEKSSEEDVDRLLPSFENIYGTKKSIQLSAIFSDAHTRKVHVLGRAGIGKSTLCEHVALQWAQEKLWDNKFSLVILVPLRNLLDSSKYFSEKTCTRANVIYHECLLNDSDIHKRIKRKKIAKLLEEKSEPVVYILDGVDEVRAFLDDENNPDESKVKKHQRRLIKNLLESEYCLITSRPFGLEEHFGANSSTTLLLENMGFSDESITDFVKLFFLTHISSRTQATSLASGLLSFIKTNANIKGIAHIPINLTYICEFWQNHSQEVSGREDVAFGSAQLYTRIVNDLCIRTLHKKGQTLRNKSEDIIDSPDYENVINFLCHLAMTQMQKTELIISTDTLKEHQACFPKKVLARVLDVGLLKSTGETHTKHNDRKNYYFVHLTFQEFFAALYIVKRIKARDIDIYTFILTEKYNPRFEMVWWFVAGLLLPRYEAENEVARENLEVFFSLLESPPRDHAQFYHELLIMRCMDECKLHVNKKRRENFLRSFLALIDFLIERPGKGEYDSTPKRFPTDESRQHFRTTVRHYLALSPTLFHQPEVIDYCIEIFKGNNWSWVSTSNNLSSLLEEQAKLPQSMATRIAKIICSLGMQDFSFSGIDSLTQKHPEIMTQEVIDYMVGFKKEDESRLVQSPISRSLLSLSPIKLPQSFIDEMSANLESEDHIKCSEAIAFFTHCPETPPDSIVIALVQNLQGNHSYQAERYFEKRRNINITDVVITALEQLFQGMKTKKEVRAFLEQYRSHFALYVIVLLNKLISEIVSRSKENVESNYRGGLLSNDKWGLLSLGNKSSRELKTYFKFLETFRAATGDEIENAVALLFQVGDSFTKSRGIIFFAEQKRSPPKHIVQCIARELSGTSNNVIDASLAFFRAHPTALTSEQVNALTKVLSDPEALLPWQSREKMPCNSFYPPRVLAIELLQHLPRYLTTGTVRLICNLLLSSDYQESSTAFDFLQSYSGRLDNVDALQALLDLPPTENTNRVIKFFTHHSEYFFESLPEKIAILLYWKKTVVCALEFFEANPAYVSSKIAHRVFDLPNHKFEGISAYKNIGLGNFVLNAPNDEDEFFHGTVTNFFWGDSKFSVKDDELPSFHDRYERKEAIGRVAFLLTRPSDSKKAVSQDIQNLLFSDNIYYVEACLFFITKNICPLTPEILDIIVKQLASSSGLIKQAALRYFIQQKTPPPNACTTIATALLEQDPDELYRISISDLVISFFAKHPNEITPKLFQKAKELLARKNTHEITIGIRFFTAQKNLPRKQKEKVGKKVATLLLSHKDSTVILSCLQFFSVHIDLIRENTLSHLLTLFRQSKDQKIVDHIFRVLYSHNKLILLDEIIPALQRSWPQDSVVYMESDQINLFEALSSFDYVSSFQTWEPKKILLFLNQYAILPTRLFQQFAHLLYTVHNDTDPDWTFTLKRDTKIRRILTITKSRTLKEIITSINDSSLEEFGEPFACFLAYRLYAAKIPVYRKNTHIRIGTIGEIAFASAELAEAFLGRFTHFVSQLRPFTFSMQIENALPFLHLFNKPKTPDTVEKPYFLSNQNIIYTDNALNQQCIDIKRRVLKRGRPPTIFLSHAWQFITEEDSALQLHDQWTDDFVRQLAKDLRFLGFDPILDFEQFGSGVDLRSTMDRAVQTADHILLICTNTYFYKLTHLVLTGVGRELGFIKERINTMGRVAAGEQRLLHGFMLTPQKPADFTIIEGYDGFAGLWLPQRGYITALLEFAEKLLRAPPLPQPIAKNMSRFGLNPAPRDMAHHAQRIHEGNQLLAETPRMQRSYPGK